MRPAVTNGWIPAFLSLILISTAEAAWAGGAPSLDLPVYSIPLPPLGTDGQRSWGNLPKGPLPSPRELKRQIQECRLGEPVTPLCAVMTFKACFEREDAELCRSVGVEGITEPKGGVRIPFEVWVIRELRVGANACIGAKPGDPPCLGEKGEVEILLLECGAPGCDPHVEGAPMSYWITPLGDRWRIKGWSDWETP